MNQDPNDYERELRERAGTGLPASDVAACEQCGRPPARVQRYMYVMSFLFVTRHRAYDALLCRDCATRRGLTELFKSATLGWWGVPWGLLTFQALFLNLRSLARWSRIPIAGVALLVLLGLAVPGVVGYFMTESFVRESRAKRSGDMASKELVAMVDEGHRLAASGQTEKALTKYLEAAKSSPRSGILSSSIADAYLSLGKYREALPYAEAAESADPDDAGYRALHGLLLFESGAVDEAQSRLERLESARPDDALAASRVCQYLYALEDWSALDGAAAAATAKFPAEPIFPSLRLYSLLGRDDLAGYLALEHTLTSVEAGATPHRGQREAAEDIDLRIARAIHTLRTEPSAGTTKLLELWSENSIGNASMHLFAHAAKKAGAIDFTRRKVHDWLVGGSAPEGAWFQANAWMPPGELDRALDEFLASRSQPAPIWLRLQSLDPLDDLDRRLELAKRGRDLESPAVVAFDSIYIGDLNRKLGAEAWRAEMATHLSLHPDHDNCRLALAMNLADDRPEVALSELAILVERQPEDLAVWIELVRAEVLTIKGELETAGKTLSAIERHATSDPESKRRLQLLRLELALYQADEKQFRWYSRSLESAEPEARAAALVLNLAHQLAVGEPLSYEADVAAWLAAVHSTELRASASASTQALLLAEGMSDRATVLRALGPEGSPTVAWVELLRGVATTGKVDETGLRRFATGPRPGHWAVRMARTVVERRRSLGLDGDRAGA